MDLLMYPAWMLIGLAGLVLGFLGAGILGAGIIGGIINIVLGWTTVIVPTVPTLDPWSWLFTIVGLPSVDVTGLLYLVVVGALIGAMASYLGNFLRKKMEGQTI